MKKLAIIFADGFEEIEAFCVADIARRADIIVDLVSMNEELNVTGAHGVKLIADKIFEDMENYDMLVLPGGAGAWKNRDDERVISLIQKYNKKQKFIASICAAPMALGEAGIIKGKRVTCYPSEDIIDCLGGAEYIKANVVVDGNIITSRGPATAFEFAYKLVEVLEKDTNKLKEDMLYSDNFGI